MPISAVDAISPALDHTRQQLFGPFRIGQWTKLALVGMLAGELGSGGCNTTHVPGSHGGLGSLPPIDHALLAALLTTGIVAAFTIGIILMYIGSVMRFVLFDSIVTRECHIRQSWSRRLTPGWRYFVFKLLFVVLSLAGISALIGVPLALAFAKGWFHSPKEHLPALIIGGLFLGFLLIAYAIVTAIALTLIKDFVIPQMALEELSVAEAWNRLWSMMQAEASSYFIYIVMKIVLGMIGGVLVFIATLILTVIFLLPVALAVVAILTGKASGFNWNAHTIFLAVAAGTILVAAFLYFVSLLSVPIIVFFPAYSYYFFASRYPRLSAVLYPTPPAPQSPGGIYSPTPPPLPS